MTVMDVAVREIRVVTSPGSLSTSVQEALVTDLPHRYVGPCPKNTPSLSTFQAWVRADASIQQTVTPRRGRGHLRLITFS
jgi:hypothetical protein